MGKPAARIGDMHICLKVNPGPVPHVGGLVTTGSPNVRIGGRPAACVGDIAACVGGTPDVITEGSTNVFINGKPAAFLGSATAHGGKITSGCTTVRIGTGVVSKAAAENTAPRKTRAKKPLPSPPGTQAAAIQRLEDAAKNIQSARETGNPLPTSPYTTQDKMQVVKTGLDERFIMRIIQTNYAGDEGYIGRPSRQGMTTYWTTTYTQLEHADTDAELIANALGLDYNPDTDYTLLLIDQETAYKTQDMESFIPTTENIAAFAQVRLKKKFKANLALIVPALSVESSQGYEAVVEYAKENNLDLASADHFKEYAEEMNLSEDEAEILQVRHQLKDKLGANEQFLGNGLANNRQANPDVTPFGPADPEITYGPLEVFTYDKNPRTLGLLEQEGIVTRIPLNNGQ